MGLSWLDIESKKRGLGNKLLDSVLSNADKFNEQGIANTLLSLNQMGLSLDDIEATKPGLGNKLLDSVSRNVSNFNPQEVSNTLLSYIRMISNISMTDTEKETHIKALNNLFARAKLMYVNNQFLNIDLRQISEAITWSKAYGFGDYTANFTGVNLDTDITESRLQKDVTAKLKALAGDDYVQVEKGFGFADCLRVDCYIGTHNLVVEIDGPTHYDKDGRLNYASRQRQTLLEKLGLKLERIKYDDWDNTSEIEQKNLLKDMLHKHDPASVASGFGIFRRARAPSVDARKSEELNVDAKEFIPRFLRR